VREIEREKDFLKDSFIEMNVLFQVQDVNETYLLIFFFQGEFLLLDNFELIAEVKFGGLLL